MVKTIWLIVTDFFKKCRILYMSIGFPGWLSGKDFACNAGDTGSNLGSGRSPREGNGNPLQCSCLGNLKYRGAWWATVHGVVKESGIVTEQQQQQHTFITLTYKILLRNFCV